MVGGGKMEEKEFRELSERVAKLEKATNNGLKEDIKELKEKVDEIHGMLTEIIAETSGIKANQKIQWWFISAILATLIASIVKFWVG